MTSGVAVDARGWGWRHASRRAWAVSELDLRVEPGQRVLLLGASGSGKSTLLAGLAGVLGGAEEGEWTGELLLDGIPPIRQRGRAGLLLQDPETQMIMSRVGDDVAFGCENLGVPRDELWRRVGWALDQVGLDVPQNAPTAALSGGQKQRLALAGLLAMQPGLLLLDEPTANLDPQGVEEVRDAVVRSVAASGATLIVVEHRVDVWRHLVDRVVVLDARAGILADGPPDAVLGSHADTLEAAGVWVTRPGVKHLARSAPARHLLTAKDLTVGRRAPGSRRDSSVASGLEAEVPAGRALAITGRNGAGKTTLALTLAGLLPALSGTVEASTELANGAGADPRRWRSRELLGRIGYVFQEPEHQFLTGTVRDELAVGPRALGQSAEAIRNRTDELLARLRLERLAAANPFTLSGGEKRRLSVATALATRPRVLMLDEPTFGQDLRTWRELVTLFDELVDEGAAVVMVTHDRELVAACADDELVVGVAGTGAPDASPANGRAVGTSAVEMRAPAPQNVTGT